ncbi:ParB/RepB/Spo0J family partition protein [Georgenia thermotolerans]|uniref:ParB/RepB/Spo0J family partition protein n=1 Tax=Georgenia thermotolerans TaxID=527326 RepID=A0A7J5UMS1_9MICO|nr:ParB/RepB/Spo0J family partition protein [Georgenia thermotolerans]KAE8763560.1 ParB/RepB/Spo0J family partition protein [Georgenia thermotolerans]
MSEKRRGLGRGIGALIPSGPAPAPTTSRPADMFFQSSSVTPSSGDEAPGPDEQDRPATKRPTSQARAAAEALMQPSEAAKSRSASASRKSKTTKPSTGRDTKAGAAAPTASPAVATPASPTARPTSAPTAASEARPDEEASVDLAPSADATQTESNPTPSVDAAANPLAAEDGQPDPAADEKGDDPDDGGLVPVPGASFAELPLNQIVPNTRQPRQVFDEEDLDELAASIREVGVLQPVVVRPLTAPVDGAPEARYELIMGERRWRASAQAGSETVPAVIRDTSDGDLLRDALLENLHRADLNPLEEAAAYQQLLEDFGCTHDELATRIARSRPQISNTLRLLKLPPLVQRRVAAGVLSAGHARALLGLSDGAAMERLAQRIVAEGLSVRATEEIVALGDEPVAPEMRRRPRTGAHTEVLNTVAARLADRFDTRVKVNLGQRKGRIAIEFASMEDLNRILDVLAPDEARLLQEEPGAEA